MYCLGTLAAVFLGFAVYQVFWGIRDLRLASRLRRGEAVPIGEAKVGPARIVLAEALPAEGVHSLVDGAPRAWVRGRLACVVPDTDGGRGDRVELLVEHEPAPLSIRDASGTAEVVPRRAHDALPRVEVLELEPDALPEALERTMREAGAPASPSGGAPSRLWYEENAFDPGDRLYVFGRVTRAAHPGDGGAYRGKGRPARIEDAVVSPDGPVGLSTPFRNRGLMLLLGGLVLSGLGAAMLSVMLRSA